MKNMNTRLIRLAALASILGFLLPAVVEGGRRECWLHGKPSGVIDKGAEQQTEARHTPPPANADDVKSLEAILAALYDVISGATGKARDWDRFRSLFVPGARLIPASKRPDGSFEARILDPEGFISLAAPIFERDGFFEKPVANKVESFGQIAHVFSTYETRHKPDDKTPIARGINSIQLLNDSKRWWIVTIYWDSERPGSTLPQKYLPR